MELKIAPYPSCLRVFEKQTNERTLNSSPPTRHSTTYYTRDTHSQILKYGKDTFEKIAKEQQEVASWTTKETRRVILDLHLQSSQAGPSDASTEKLSRKSISAIEY